jgi:Raf kinase inhibitor-like YbhB/YbcL family protein
MRQSMFRVALPMLALGAALLGTAGTGAAQGPLLVTSPKFANNGPIPDLYTCKGSNLSPPIEWSTPPPGTRTLALIVQDPDAGEPGQRGFVHWVVYDIPATATGLKEAAKREADFPRGTREGLNDARRAGWTAPCPPNGTHHYHFDVYALDETVDQQGASKVELEDWMKGHVLAHGELVGLVAHK